MTKFSTSQPDPAIAERDYLQHHIICALAALRDDRIIFKGGTLLRVCGLVGYRFSDDLDFDFRGDRKVFLQLLATAVAAAQATSGISMWLDPVEAQRSIAHVRWDETDPLRSIKVDVSVSPQEHLPTQRWEVLPNYDDLPPSPPIRGYTLESMACVKLACIASRSKPRDFYDFDRLIEAGIDLDEVWAMHVIDVDHRRAAGLRQPDPIQTRNSYQSRLARLTEAWQPFLDAGSIPGAPAFEDIVGRVDAVLLGLLQRWREQLSESEVKWRRVAPARVVD